MNTEKLTTVAYGTLVGHTIDLPGGSSKHHKATLCKDADGMLHIHLLEVSGHDMGPMKPGHWRGDVGQTLLANGYMALKIAAADMAQIERAFPGIFTDSRPGSSFSDFELALLKTVRAGAKK